MNKTRAEPGKRRLDGFMEWCWAVIKGNTSDGTHRNAQIIDTKKGGEDDG